MDRNSNSYTFIYASVMVVMVAAILSVAAINLKPFQAKNVEIEKKQNILKSVNIITEAAEAEAEFEKSITAAYVVNAAGDKVEGSAFDINLKVERSKALADRMLPVYEADLGDAGKKYIIPLRGTGLWGAIWGYVALNDDLNTIYGATFDHEGETPGLGAEISTPGFQEPFKGKTIFNAANEFVSILIAKAGEKADPAHSVDGISGGTITSKGLQQMLEDDLKTYQEFFKKVR